MADKNLHDIKIDELDNKKKTPLKNILTLLALLFIILVISVVITKLILNTDDTENIDSNYTSTEASVQTDGENNSNLATAAGVAVAGAAGTLAATANSATDSVKNTADSVAKTAKDTLTAPTINNALKERNTSSSKTKVPLRDHQPVKTVKELKHTTTTTSTKKTPVKTTTTTKKSPTKLISHNDSHTDKVIVTRNTSRKTSTSKHSKGSIGSTVSKLSHGFYIKVGTFKNTKTVIAKIKKTGLNYKLVKTNNGLTRAYIGRFSTKSSAKSNLRKARTVNPSAFIYEEK